MTLHDAIRAGIWNATGWSHGAFAIRPEPEPVDNLSPVEGTGAGKYGSAIERPQRSRNGDKGIKKRSWLSETPEKEAKEANAAVDAAKVKPAPMNAADHLKQRTALHSDEDANIDSGDLEPIDEGEVERPNGQTRLDALKTSPKFKQMETIPSIPVYRAHSTPIDPGYDDAPVEERRSRIIDHLDRSSPIPFSAFVDNNKERRIHPLLFQTMLDALRRLAKDPASNDSAAQDMKSLLKHWFRAAYHYLDKNSNPSDGYPHILSVVSRGTKDPKKAEVKAKELFWRRQATDFWMTLVDLFSSEKIDIDLLHKSISTKTSLNPWF
jgi:hypothetical protein